MNERPIKLTDIRSPDGSRHFAAIPDHFGTHEWNAMQERLGSLQGVTVTVFSDAISQALTDFNYRGHQFTVDTQFGELWLFSVDPNCPDEILIDVVSLFQKVSD